MSKTSNNMFNLLKSVLQHRNGPRLAAVCMIVSHDIVVADSRVVSNDGFGFAKLAERVTSNHPIIISCLAQSRQMILHSGTDTSSDTSLFTLTL